MSIIPSRSTWALVFALSFALTSCQKKEETPPQKQAEGGKTLNFYLHTEPASMHPQKAGNRFSQIITRELYEGLMRMDKRGIPTLALADSIELATDKRSYRFTLRPSNWSNGLPVTAHDFEYAWKWALLPTSNTHCSDMFYCIKNAKDARLGHCSIDEVGIHALDDRTLVVDLEYQAPYFVELTANPVYSPICKAVCEKNPNWHNAVGKDFVTNGPFVLDTWKNQSEIVLTKNPYYWDTASVSVQKMTFPIIREPQTALSMFESNLLDWVGDPFGPLPLDAIPELKRQKKLQALDVESLCWYECNIVHPLLSSQKVRKALALALNRQELVEHLLQGGEKPAFTILPRSLSQLTESPIHDNDIQRARALLDEGLSELHLTKEGLPPIRLCYSDDPRERLICEAVQQQWQNALNIRFTLSPADWNAHLHRSTTGDYDICMMNWYTFYNDPIYNLAFLKYKTGGWNATGWEHPEYISLLDRSDQELSIEGRNELLRQAEALVMDEMPVIPICYGTSKFIKNSKVVGEALSPILATYEWKQVDIEGKNLILVNK